MKNKTLKTNSENSINNYTKLQKSKRQDSIEGSVHGSSYESSSQDSNNSRANNKKLVLKDNSVVNNNNFINNGDDNLTAKDAEPSPYEDLDKYEPKEIPNDIV
jgi:hypothetical protein